MEHDLLAAVPGLERERPGADRMLREVVAPAPDARGRDVGLTGRAFHEDLRVAHEAVYHPPRRLAREKAERASGPMSDIEGAAHMKSQDPLPIPSFSELSLPEPLAQAIAAGDLTQAGLLALVILAPLGVRVAASSGSMSAPTRTARTARPTT